MKKLIYFALISTLFIACEEDFPIYDGSIPQPIDTILIDPNPDPMDTIIVNPNPMDSIIDPNPMDTIIVDPNPMDTIIVDPNPMDTIIDPNPMDTIIMIDPNPIDTIINPNPMDTIMTNPDPADNLLISGLAYGNSDKTFDDANTTIIDALNAIDPIKIVAEINHTDNAASVDKMLNPTKIILFGNPNLGTPLMQKNQLAGLDLPQKLLLFEDEDAQLKVAYNSVDYLTQRHGLEGIGTLENIAGALANFAGMVATEDLISIETTSVNLMEGIIIKTSLNTFEETYTKLKATINASTNIKVIAELDHQANAASVDLELAPTRLIIFGNPNLGTPLMQNAQTIGIDLPQKMLVYENEANETFVAYNDPAFLANRHGVTDNEDVLETITNALGNLSLAATH